MYMTTQSNCTSCSWAHDMQKQRWWWHSQARKHYTSSGTLACSWIKSYQWWPTLNPCRSCFYKLCHSAQIYHIFIAMVYVHSFIMTCLGLLQCSPYRPAEVLNSSVPVCPQLCHPDMVKLAKFLHILNYMRPMLH